MIALQVIFLTPLRKLGVPTNRFPLDLAIIVCCLVVVMVQEGVDVCLVLLIILSALGTWAFYNSWRKGMVGNFHKFSSLCRCKWRAQRMYPLISPLFSCIHTRLTLVFSLALHLCVNPNLDAIILAGYSPISAKFIFKKELIYFFPFVFLAALGAGCITFFISVVQYYKTFGRYSN